MVFIKYFNETRLRSPRVVAPRVLARPKWNAESNAAAVKMLNTSIDHFAGQTGSLNWTIHVFY
jgi:hypothetical protein